jgi:hypothetical protein
MDDDGGPHARHRARVEKILKGADGNPDAVVDWPEAIAEQRRAEDEDPFAHVGSGERLLRAMTPEVPADAADAIRRRTMPYLEWIAALTKKTEKPGDEE